MNWEKIKLGLLSAIGGAIVVSIIGFKWGGWVTGGTAQTMVEEMAATAIAGRLGPICVAQFNRDSNKDQKLKELKAQGYGDRGRYVEKQGWATMPGEKKPDSKVADACANQLMQTS